MKTGAHVVDPFKLAKHQRTLDGKLALKDFSRAKNSLAEDTSLDLGEVSFSVYFALDDDGVCVISGEIQGDYPVKCERCLQVFMQTTKTSFKVSPVGQERDASALPDEYEPVMLIDNKLNIAELIEDEFILALPIVPKHKLGATECVEIVSEVDDKPNNPFKVLQDMKLNRTNYEAGDE